MLPLREGTATQIRGEILSVATFHAAYELKRCIRTRRYKLIAHWPPDKIPPSNCDNSPNMDILFKQDLYSIDTPHFCLYDLLRAPQKRNNLAEDPTYRPIRDELYERLKRWMRTTDNPLCIGEVSPPIDAIVHTSDSLCADGPI